MFRGAQITCWADGECRHNPGVTKSRKGRIRGRARLEPLSAPAASESKKFHVSLAAFLLSTSHHNLKSPLTLPYHHTSLSVVSCLFCGRLLHLRPPDDITSTLNNTTSDRSHSLTHANIQTNKQIQTRTSNIVTMADSLNMNGLSLKDSQHAPNGGPQQNGFSGERSAYIPPHMRGRGGAQPPAAAPNGFDGGPAPMSNGMNSSAWAPNGAQK